MKNPEKILLIVQRSNGDVFLSLNLICNLYEYFNAPKIDILVNDDTYPIASLLPNIDYIHKFSYKQKTNSRWSQEALILKNIYRKYDLSINLTASDRSVLYTIFASKFSISAIERNNRKSWWKKILLTYYYYFDTDKHILINNSEPLNLLKINHTNIQRPIDVSEDALLSVKQKLKNNDIKNFIIFHPSAQYNYKIYPLHLRNELLTMLNSLGIPILITGSNNQIDTKIKKEIPTNSNIYNFIGKTSLEEYFALSQLSMAYIGMDTLNMHIAASQNKPIFAIFGPTNLRMWSPWSNFLQKATKTNKPIQKYENITLFQSSTPCISCGMIGCGSNHNIDKFSYDIKPIEIFDEFSKWFKNNSSIN